VRISRVQIRNFANFSELDVRTGENIVIVGENKVGKSNFVRALQLILDPGLSERDRQLGLDQFWDGLGEAKIGATVEISIELTDFTDNPRLMTYLNDCVVDPGPPMVARLTYRFQPKANLGRDAEGLADYEYIIFGGNNPDMGIDPSLRRMLPLDVQDALRDAEKELSSWRNSPLRPLIEELATSLDEAAREEVQEQVNTAQAELVAHAEVLATASRISQRLMAFEGGVRLFAVGDADQSIYGFTGADGALLLELAEREDVERVQLQLNYRSASRIVSASEMAVEQPSELRPRLAPASGTPSGAVLDPTGERDLAIRCGRVDPDVIVTRRGHRFGDDISGSIILVEDGDVANASARFSGERRRPRQPRRPGWLTAAPQSANLSFRQGL
jgi:AAA ATPase domain